MDDSKLVVVVLVLVPLFWAKFQRGLRQVLSLTIPTVLNHTQLSPFRCTKRMLSQKEHIETRPPKETLEAVGFIVIMLLK